MTNPNYQKLFISLRYYLIGKAEENDDYKIALEALEFAKKYHIGTRKDGATPEFQHQIEIAHYIRTIPNLMFPAHTIAVALLHDICEDYNISYGIIRKKFGKKVAKSVKLLTKVYNGKKKDILVYFEKMVQDPIATIVKGSDRIHNQGSMHPVFNDKKQMEYIDETTTHIIPMLKKARHLHVKQEAAYENIKFVLRSQINFTNQRLAIVV